MTKLEQQHWDAITDIYADTGAWGEYGGINRDSQKEALKVCTEITIEQMKGFAEWIGSHGYWLEDMTMLWFEDEHEADGCYSTEELLTEYLKTLS